MNSSSRLAAPATPPPAAASFETFPAAGDEAANDVSAQLGRRACFGATPRVRSSRSSLLVDCARSASSRLLCSSYTAAANLLVSCQCPCKGSTFQRCREVRSQQRREAPLACRPRQKMANRCSESILNQVLQHFRQGPEITPRPRAKRCMRSGGSAGRQVLGTFCLRSCSMR